MHSIADRAGRTAVAALSGLMLAALAGCAMSLPDKPQRPQPYDLGPALSVAAAAAPSGPALAIERVESSAAIDGSNIIYRLLYSDGGQQPRPYAQARWTMSPPQLVGQRLREAFSATRPVVEPGAGLAALELRTELDEFAHVFESPNASAGVVRLRVTVTAPARARSACWASAPSPCASPRPPPTPPAAWRPCARPPTTRWRRS